MAWPVARHDSRAREADRASVFAQSPYASAMRGTMKTFRLRLVISAREMLTYYNGDAQQVFAKARDGTRVRFPARVLRPYVTSEGVDGEFLLRCDESFRFISLDKFPE